MYQMPINFALTYIYVYTNIYYQSLHTYYKHKFNSIIQTYLNGHDMLIDEVEKPQLLFYVKLNSSTHHDARDLDQRSLPGVHKQLPIYRHGHAHV